MTLTRPPALIAACWTAAGNADARSGIVPSPVDIVERIETAAAIGWRGFGILHADLVQARDSMGLSELRRVLDDNGMEFVELEYLLDWWTQGDARVASDVVRRDLLDAYGVLGARHIKVGPGIPGEPVSRERMVDSWGELCSDAAAYDARLALECEPFSYFPTVESVMDVVNAVRAENGGVLLDVWHVHRSGLPYDQLGGLVPGELVFAVELSDADAEVRGSLFDDTIDHRRYCGEGAFEVPAFIDAISAMGFDGPWGVEIISEAHRALPIREGLERAYRSTIACFDRAAAR